MQILDPCSLDLIFARKIKGRKWYDEDYTL